MPVPASTLPRSVPAPLAAALALVLSGLALGSAHAGCFSFLSCLWGKMPQEPLRLVITQAQRDAIARNERALAMEREANARASQARVRALENGILPPPAVIPESTPAQPQDNAHFGNKMKRVVVKWNGEELTPMSGPHAVIAVLRVIERYSAPDSARLNEAREYGCFQQSRLVPHPFDELWSRQLKLGYRPLQADDGDVVAAIETSIGDIDFEKTDVNNLLVKLPHPMRFADLPHRDRIVAVVAESPLRDSPSATEALREAFKHHYVVLARVHRDDGRFSVLRTVPGHEAEPMKVRFTQLHPEEDSSIKMDRVGYVIYR